jgi:hypothetical protein
MGGGGKEEGSTSVDINIKLVSTAGSVRTNKTSLKSSEDVDKEEEEREKKEKREEKRKREGNECNLRMPHQSLFGGLQPRHKTHRECKCMLIVYIRNGKGKRGRRLNGRMYESGVRSE